MTSIVDEAKEYYQYVGRYVDVTGEVFEDGTWRPYGFASWVAAVSVSDDTVFLDSDYGMSFAIRCTDDTHDKLRNITILVVESPTDRKPSWELEPPKWEFADGVWRYKRIPTGKAEGCRDCELFDCKGPVLGEFTQEFSSGSLNIEPPYTKTVDVIFVGEALGAVETQKRRPFVGPAGRVLRQSIAQVGITSCGITNIWKCRPPGNEVPASDPGLPCRDWLYEDLTTHNQTVVVPLGATALDALTSGRLLISEVQGRMFSTTWHEHNLLLLPMWHPAFILRKRALWRDWELSMEKLKRFLDTGETNYIPLSARTIHKAFSRGQVLAFLERLRSTEFSRLDIDIETNSFFMPWEDGYILSIAFGWSPTEGCSIPWRIVTQFSEVRTEMKALLEDQGKKFVGYNLPFDVQFLWNEDMQMRIGGDSMLKVHLNDERGEETHSLKKDSGVYLNAPDWEEDIKRWVPKKDMPYTLIPEERLMEYNGMDTVHNLQLEDVLTDMLHDEWGEPREDGWGTPLAVYERISIPAANLLARARYIGVRVDIYRLKELHDRFVPVLSELTGRLIELTGNPYFNPNSWQDKLKSLHEAGFKVPNTRAETLQVYEGDELIDAMLAYSQAHKIFSTYVTGIADDISIDLRVHPDFRLPAETGRLRCSDPNMLGMPRKAEEQEHKWKRFVKEIFIADPDTLLFHVDEKQSEVRCGCFLANDPDLARVIASGEDVHGSMALEMYGEGYTHEQRVWAKMVTFGLIYNREAPSLARQLTAIARAEARAKGSSSYHKWTVREAQAIIDRFFSRMPRLVAWKNETMDKALTDQYLVSWFGRVRRFGLITYQNRKHIENEAVNFPISSVSSDINLLNCMEAQNRFQKYGFEIYVPIHDAALGRVPKDSLSILDEVKDIFETLPNKVLHTDLPFKVDVSIGERWSDL